MRNILITALLCLIPIIFFAAEKDAKGCKDHPLIARVPGYYIAACNEIPAGADLDIIKGKDTETVHFNGKSIAYSFMPKSGLKTKPSDKQIRSHYDDVIKKSAGSLYGVTNGQKWPVYMFAKEGKKYWVILMLDSGKYFTGSYALRIIEN